MKYLSAHPPVGGVLSLVSSIYRRRKTGTLELTSDEGTLCLHFVSGQLFLPLATPWAEAQGTAETASSIDESNDYRAREVGNRIIKYVSGARTSGYRLIDGLEPGSSKMIGPISTAEVLLQVVSNLTDSSDVIAAMGGPKTNLVASTIGDPTFQPEELSKEELALLFELREPAPISAVLNRTGVEGGATIESLARLWAVGLIREAPGEDTISEIEKSTRQAPVKPLAPPEDPAWEVDSLDSEIWKHHFHLTSIPFSLTPDPSFLFLSECHAEALAGLKLSLIEKRGLTALTGEVGTGKTTLLYSLLSSLGPEIETAYIHNTSLPFDELLQAALADFGVPCESTRRIDLLDALNDFLTRSTAANKTVALVIDEAQNLANETFEQLRLLLNFETFDKKLLQIILVGQPELGERLRSTRLRQIADRIATRCHLRPLNPEESVQYIVHRLKAAGGEPSLFSRAAIKLTANKSRGIPRRMNVLCHNAMLIAFSQGSSTVSRGSVAEAVREVNAKDRLVRWRGPISIIPELSVLRRSSDPRPAEGD